MVAFSKLRELYQTKLKLSIKNIDLFKIIIYSRKELTKQL